jgi:hypothetical protein
MASAETLHQIHVDREAIEAGVQKTGERIEWDFRVLRA